MARDSNLPATGPHDDISVPHAKSSWYLGDWGALSAIGLPALRQHPDRGLLALLVGSAHQQLGRHDAARQYVQLAMDWGCHPAVVAQVLIAGVHNTLGRAAALARDQTGAIQHFEAAVSAGASGKDAAFAGHIRSVREMTRLELLPQAAGLLDRELAKTQDLSVRPEETRARVRMLETELELLHHELSLAQQRQQLFHRPARGSAGPGADRTKPDWREALKKKSVSQLGQDLWVLEQTAYKNGGFFVEFGATDGVLLSNTYLLEKEFGWKGLCAEPNPKLFRQLKKNRACTVSKACIAGETGAEIEFILADAYGGMAKYAAADMHADKRAAYAASGKTMRVKTVSLDDFLRRNKAPHDIDYLSIDTEGSELEILSAFPFNKWNIRLITVEHNFTPQRRDIRELLGRNGFRCIEHEWDDWYVREAGSRE